MELKAKYQLPLLYSKSMFNKCNNKDECLMYIIKNESGKFLLDYKESNIIKEIRRDYYENKRH